MIRPEQRQTSAQKSLTTTLTSRLGVNLIRAADQLVTYGFVPFRVEPNFTETRPHIHVESCEGAYYDIDRFGSVLAYAHLFRRRAGDLAAMFPEYADKIMTQGMYGSTDESSMMEVVRFYDENESVMFLPEREGLVLAKTPNPLGRVPIAIAQRLASTERPVGSSMTCSRCTPRKRGSLC